MIHTVRLADFLNFVDLSHSRWFYLFKSGLILFKSPWSQIQPEYGRCEAFLVSWTFSILSLSHETLPHFYSTELIIGKIFYVEIPKEHDPAYLALKALQGHSKDIGLCFAMIHWRHIQCHSGAFPMQFQSMPQTWDGLWILLLNLAPAGCSTKSYVYCKVVSIDIRAFLLVTMSYFEAIWEYAIIWSDLLQITGRHILLR